jgi:quercetin dioxygenase-like cupin family protein
MNQRLTILERTTEKLEAEISEKIKRLSRAYGNSGEEKEFENCQSEIIQIQLKKGDVIPLHNHGPKERKEVLVMMQGVLWFGEEGKEENVVESKVVDASRYHHAKAITDVTAYLIYIPKLDN